MNLYAVIAFIIFWRLLSVFIVQTYYVPDEYWQSLEVAHRLVFSYGYLTWEWTAGLRSYLYPLWFASIYKVLAVLQLDNVKYLVLLPRVAQALLTSYADYRFFVWSGRRKWALFLSVISWYSFYTGSRTLYNSLETSLTTIALSYFPWFGESSSYLWLVALVCYLRPTAATVWLPLCFYHLQKSRYSSYQLLIQRFLPIGLLVGAACAGIDSYFYGRWIITPFEFLKHNIYNNIGRFYGTHSWYWYLSVDLPVLLGITLLPFLFGTVETLRNQQLHPVRKQLLISIIFTIAILSVLSHKELRFLAALLPLCLYISADFLTRWSYKAKNIYLWLIAGILLFGNLVPALYLGQVHQKGPIELMTKINEISINYRDGARRATILYLMPCHSTPFYSHVHENVTMRFLTCEPDLQGTENYLDEADQFYKDPEHWLASHIPSYPRHALPTHLVFFNSLQEKIAKFLLAYKPLYEIDHAKYFDKRTGDHILIYQRLALDESGNKFNRDDEYDVNLNRQKPKQRLYPDPNVEDPDQLYHEEPSRNLYN